MADEVPERHPGPAIWDSPDGSADLMATNPSHRESKDYRVKISVVWPPDSRYGASAQA